MSDNQPCDDERTLYLGDASTPATATGELAPGFIVGGAYRIRATIGRGGMGVVYAAEHVIIKRVCALKALAADLINESNWQRFQTEGRAISRLDHPNIVKIYDMGTDGPQIIYYAMELLQGMSLAEAIEQRRYLDVSDTLVIFAQLCSGLSYAHENGIVHRDIKPSNIFLCPDRIGRDGVVVKIIDFGIAKLVGEAGQLKQSQTATGQICGSPIYMSPEQCIGGAVDARSDIYSLGCTLFEALTGAPPFKGLNPLDTAFMHQNEKPPRLSEFRPNQMFGESLEQIVARMLEKKPSGRYQTIAQVGEDIARVIEGKIVDRSARHLNDPAYLSADENIEKALATGRFSRTAFLYILTAIFVLGIACGAVFLLHPPPKKTAYSVLVHKVVLSEKEENVKSLYAKWPQISQGVTEKDGNRVRVFNFPEIPLGFISWGAPGAQAVLARGEIVVPAWAPVRLELPRPEGVYTRLFPDILARIGPDDIDTLLVAEPQVEGDESLLLSDVSPALIRAIAGWKALRVLDFYHCTLKKEAVLALNQLRPVEELHMRDATVDGVDLAQVQWLKSLTYIDAKNCEHVDQLLFKLAGSSHLEILVIDATEPSAAGLAALASCPNLKNLSLGEDIVDVARATSLAKIKSLRTLSFKDTVLTAQCVRELAPLTNLRTIHIVTEEEGVKEALKSALPRCNVLARPVPQFAGFKIHP